MSTNLPINWIDKVNSPALLAYLQQFGEQTYLTAEDINQIRDAINELDITAQDLAIVVDANLIAAQSYAANLITQLINGAPSDGDTLKELNDKIVALQAIVGGTTPDGDSVVNTVTELLAVFAAFPEGVDVNTLFASKADKTDIYNALDCIVSGKMLDARQGKALSDMIASLTTVVNEKENTSNKTSTITGNETSTSLFANIFGIITWIKNGFIGQLPTKSTALIDTDLIVVGDSEDANKTKTRTFGQLLVTIRAYLESFFATISALNAVDAKIPTNYSKIVYFNTATPVSATIFDLANPPVTNDNSLKADVNNLYVGTDANTWVYNSTSSTYGAKAVSNLFPVEVTGNQIVQESWNNKDVYVMGSGTLTYPNTGLSAGHNFNLCADAGVTIAWAIASPKTWRVAGLPVGTAPPSVIAGQFCMISARIGSNEIRVLGL